MTALHMAASGGHCGVIKELLNSKADVNAKTRYGDTPLHMATVKGRNDAVAMLLNSCADVNVKNKNKMTALHVVLFLRTVRRHDIMNELINFHADVNVKDINGDTPLSIAHRTKDAEAIRILLNNGAKSNKGKCVVM